jgi:hypothetical protein
MASLPSFSPPPDEAAFDPTPPGRARRPTRRGVGNHVRELRWQAELARLLVDPLFRRPGMPHGDGVPVTLLLPRLITPRRQEDRVVIIRANPGHLDL